MNDTTQGEKKQQRFETHVGSLTVGAFCLVESLAPAPVDDALAMNRQVVVVGCETGVI